MRGMPEIRAAKDNTITSLMKDIAERNVMIGQMVGTLYPYEKQELQNMISELRYCNHEHEYYAAEDFTPEEIARENVLAVLVLKEGKQICKRCGYEQV